MKINISRPNIYLLIVATILLVCVLLFSFLVLIPNGKKYREQRIELARASQELRKYEDFNNQTLSKLKKLQSKNRYIISAFSAIFNPDRFEKENSVFFESLKLSKLELLMQKNDFDVYEVNTTSKINSPKSFYNFLDSINKSDWIISVNFPINFKREKDMIRSSFTMKVYSTHKKNL